MLDAEKEQARINRKQEDRINPTLTRNSSDEVLDWRTTKFPQRDYYTSSEP